MGTPTDIDVYKENDNLNIDMYDSDGFICAGILVKPSGKVFWHFPLSDLRGEWSEEKEDKL